MYNVDKGYTYITSRNILCKVVCVIDVVCMVFTVVLWFGVFCSNEKWDLRGRYYGQKQRPSTHGAN